MAAGEQFEQSDFASNAGRADPAVLSLALGFNESGPRRYFQLFDSAALPIDTSVPLRSIVVARFANLSYAPSQQGLKFATGLWWAISTDPDTLQLDAGAEFWVTLEGRDV